MLDEVLDHGGADSSNGSRSEDDNFSKVASSCPAATFVGPGGLPRLSGSSGKTGGFPHLQFEGFRSRSYSKGNTVSLNFSKADDQLDARSGLSVGQTYPAH